MKNPQDDKCICSEINARHCPVHQDDKPREFWIKKGSGDWDYKNYDDDNQAISLDHGDDFYDKVSLVPTDDGSGVHVIEYSAYEKLQRELEQVKQKHDELLSYLPTIPSKPYEMQLAEENQKLKSELEQVKAEQKAFEKDAVEQYNKDQAEINRLRNVLAKSRIEQQEEIDRLSEALEFYANKDN